MGTTDEVQEKEEPIYREEENRTPCVSTAMLTVIRNAVRSNWKEIIFLRVSSKYCSIKH